MGKNISSVRVAVLSGLLFIFMAPSIFAQERITVRGCVTDSRGEPVIGAAVMPEGTSDGALTGVDGNYSIIFTPKS